MSNLLGVIGLLGSLSRKGDYSVRAVLDLARYWQRGRRKAREIATTMDLPDKYVGQILANLVRGGLLIAEAGPAGGYVLSRPPDEITLVEVVELAEGSVRLDECVLKGGPCDWADTCAIHEPWARAQAAFMAQLRETTFAELAAIDAAIEAGSYATPPDTPEHVIKTERHGER